MWAGGIHTCIDKLAVVRVRKWAVVRPCMQVGGRAFRHYYVTVRNS